MGAPIGNTNAQKASRLWTDAITKTVHEVDPNCPDGYKKLRSLARKLIDKGLEGDTTALREIGDRLDGKAIQQIDLPDQHVITIVERVITSAPANALPPVADVLEHDPPALEADSTTE